MLFQVRAQLFYNDFEPINLFLLPDHDLIEFTDRVILIGEAGLQFYDTIFHGRIIHVSFELGKRIVAGAGPGLIRMVFAGCCQACIRFNRSLCRFLCSDNATFDGGMDGGGPGFNPELFIGPLTECFYGGQRAAHL